IFTQPDAAGTILRMAFNKVDLPAPLGPINPMRWPAGRAKSTPHSTGRLWYATVRSCTSTAISCSCDMVPFTAFITDLRSHSGKCGNDRVNVVANHADIRTDGSAFGTECIGEQFAAETYHMPLRF